ncbi:hypothetical protein BGAL_0020g00350 [Botrytis galanthina]|uniref:Uncharacterized protein n=1 Tax=Botrytis galanthina TaxID=278940 RepID=A0A4S8RBM5_9HELO|nr:hypothetical protein BGAL_0020g00350 [Botrytis galanthina]
MAPDYSSTDETLNSLKNIEESINEINKDDPKKMSCHKMCTKLTQVYRIVLTNQKKLEEDMAKFSLREAQLRSQEEEFDRRISLREAELNTHDEAYKAKFALLERLEISTENHKKLDQKLQGYSESYHKLVIKVGDDHTQAEAAYKLDRETKEEELRKLNDKVKELEAKKNLYEKAKDVEIETERRLRDSEKSETLLAQLQETNEKIIPMTRELTELKAKEVEFDTIKKLNEETEAWLRDSEKSETILVQLREANKDVKILTEELAKLRVKETDFNTTKEIHEETEAYLQRFLKSEILQIQVDIANKEKEHISNTLAVLKEKEKEFEDAKKKVVYNLITGGKIEELRMQLDGNRSEIKNQSAKLTTQEGYSRQLRDTVNRQNEALKSAKEQSDRDAKMIEDYQNQESREGSLQDALNIARNEIEDLNQYKELYEEVVGMNNAQAIQIENLNERLDSSLGSYITDQAIISQNKELSRRLEEETSIKQANVESLREAHQKMERFRITSEKVPILEFEKKDLQDKVEAISKDKQDLEKQLSLSKSQLEGALVKVATLEGAVSGKIQLLEEELKKEREISNSKSTTKTTIEYLESKVSDLLVIQHSARDTIKKKENEINAIKAERHKFHEEATALGASNMNLSSKIEIAKESARLKNEELQKLTKENEKINDLHRVLQTANETLKESIRFHEEQMRTLTKERDEAEKLLSEVEQLRSQVLTLKASTSFQSPGLPVTPGHSQDRNGQFIKKFKRGLPEDSPSAETTISDSWQRRMGNQIPWCLSDLSPVPTTDIDMGQQYVLQIFALGSFTAENYLRYRKKREAEREFWLCLRTVALDGFNVAKNKRPDENQKCKNCWNTFKVCIQICRQDDVTTFRIVHCMPPPRIGNLGSS